MEQNPHYITPQEAEEKRCVEAPDVWHCQGSNCMAWRWKVIAEWREGQDLLVTYSTTHGYCGMVGS